MIAPSFNNYFEPHKQNRCLGEVLSVLEFLGDFANRFF